MPAKRESNSPSAAALRKAKKVKQLEAKRKKLEAQAKAIKEEEEELRFQIIDHFNNMGEGIKSLKGTGLLVTIKEQDVPTVKNWNDLTKYVQKHKAFDLFQRRVNAKAWKDREDAGASIPGVSTYRRRTVSITKQ